MDVKLMRMMMWNTIRDILERYFDEKIIVLGQSSAN